MAISDTSASTLNKANRANQRVSLGTIFQTAQTEIDALQTNKVITSASLTVTTAHTNASVITVPTGLTAPVGFIIQTYAATGSQIGGNPYVKISGANLLVMARDAVYGISGSYVITAGNYLEWLAWER